MISWRDRGRGGNSLDGGGTSNTSEGDVSLPLGPGEWEEALGLPLCVVCQNVRSPPGFDLSKSVTNNISVGSNGGIGEGTIMERGRV
jgi:hypothetical protein